jgi:hypothetical protein
LSSDSRTPIESGTSIRIRITGRVRSTYPVGAAPRHGLPRPRRLAARAPIRPSTATKTRNPAAMTSPAPVEAGIARSEPSRNRTEPAPASMCRIACSSSRTSAVTARPARSSPRMVAREPSILQTPTGSVELSHGTGTVTVQSQGGPHPAMRRRMEARESESRPALRWAGASMADDPEWRQAGEQ